MVVVHDAAFEFAGVRAWHCSLQVAQRVRHLEHLPHKVHWPLRGEEAGESQRPVWTSPGRLPRQVRQKSVRVFASFVTSLIPFTRATDFTSHCVSCSSHLPAVRQAGGGLRLGSACHGGVREGDRSRRDWGETPHVQHLHQASSRDIWSHLHQSHLPESDRGHLAVVLLITNKELVTFTQSVWLNALSFFASSGPSWRTRQGHVSAICRHGEQAGWNRSSQSDLLLLLPDLWPTGEMDRPFNTVMRKHHSAQAHSLLGLLPGDGELLADLERVWNPPRERGHHSGNASD